ncbi:5,10-methenyltetrahydromethanopterin hydrogenase cofactor biosynthesis protein HmdB [Methanospirillum hungatei]|uniref:5,10-methenyltetrahydromethanopterin hydrogenase cofactor biosynthesis protein HmdB n=1 Tax=Methanospirillum hungatei TaxID=2203 RepID=UPI0026F12782|nr:5,10-methenyltetrahydromethanopterin hydrogenase cofactor biosynthesis protein HmdB [Methanospirillum hungatei]MCA1916574.1 5,10-methenyltetrahydromethanopterin hydrogenase cofactor biosynthesis protein HmdB [Methanospirillum hungatei]
MGAIVISRILKKIRQSKNLENHEILTLFSAKKESDILNILQTASGIRDENNVPITLTSTVHITNECSVTPKCKYCGFAAGTSRSGYYHPFHKTDEEILQAVRIIEDSGISRVSCSGAHGHGGEHALQAARIVKEHTNLDLLVNVGTDLSADTIHQLAAHGTDTLCCNLETTNETLFSYIKPGEKFYQRVKVCNMISESGLELSSGLLIGIGESNCDRLYHLKFLRAFKTLGEIPIMGFQPYIGTPMEHHPRCSMRDQLLTIAITRILYPDIRITVPTPTIGPENVRKSLMAGANNLATVIPDSYPHDIKGVGSPVCGTLSDVRQVLDEMGLKYILRTHPLTTRQKIPVTG